MVRAKKKHMATKIDIISLFQRKQDGQSSPVLPKILVKKLIMFVEL